MSGPAEGFEPIWSRPHPADSLGMQHIYRFPNGYGASVVRFRHGYGAEDGCWELAVIRFLEGDNYTLDYGTPITDDVLGHLTESEVAATLARVRDLPEPGSAP